MNESIKQDKIYFEHLDVLRFAAAFMITILHAYEAWSGWYGEIEVMRNEDGTGFSTVGSFVNEFIKNLNVGVDVFFLISGFLITYILLEEKKRFGKIHIGKFMIRRSLRIWPLYFFLIAITPFLVSWLNVDSPNYLANIFFVGNFDTINTQSWIYPFSHFWSICIEEHFYLIWPFVILLIPKNRLLQTFAILFIASISFRLVTAYVMEYPWFTMYLHTLSRIDGLVVGAIGAYFYSIKPFIVNIKKYQRIGLILILLFLFSIDSINSVAFLDSFVVSWFKRILIMFIIAALLLDYNFNPNFNHFFRKKSVIHYFGKISYGIYMYGNMLLIVIIKKIMWTYEIRNEWAFFAIVIVLSILIPIISYELFEKQVLKLNKRFKVVKTDR